MINLYFDPRTANGVMLGAEDELFDGVTLIAIDGILMCVRLGE